MKAENMPDRHARWCAPSRGKGGNVFARPRTSRAMPTTEARLRLFGKTGSERKQVATDHADARQGQSEINNTRDQ